MDQIHALWAQFGAAHPIYSHALVLFVGVFLGPRLVAAFEKNGIPWLVHWADDHQEALLARAGLTPEQIMAVREHEIADLRKSADELQKEQDKAKADQTKA